jgi:hypothetical protein
MGEQPSGLDHTMAALLTHVKIEVVRARKDETDGEHSS